jgi:hypothetical protein
LSRFIKIYFTELVLTKNIAEADVDESQNNETISAVSKSDSENFISKVGNRKYKISMIQNGNDITINVIFLR